VALPFGVVAEDILLSIWSPEEVNEFFLGNVADNWQFSGTAGVDRPLLIKVFSHSAAQRFLRPVRHEQTRPKLSSNSRH